MTKLIKKNLTTYNDSYYGDFSLDVPRLSRHAAQRATERKIPAVELLRSKSHINAYIDKVVSKTGVVITAYPRVQGGNRNYELPENGRRYTFPKDGIGLFIGKEHANIKRIQAEYQLKELYFDSYDVLIAVASSSDYDWTLVEQMIEKARKAKYKPQKQLLMKKNANQ
ncbi:unnamed protein product [Rotaria sp. Silwood1]|nr:unnamed protein product [Rotaria sp. Silwood1]CAF5002401.1 unnamed protein product [Rotaria sp. Silwood1]CAF5046311.1 unnamed protein product [Rotaria sp. Silwood1]CAF5046972.1 unnamed protein product [Rotaria sp. Silwood1]